MRLLHLRVQQVMQGIQWKFIGLSAMVLRSIRMSLTCVVPLLAVHTTQKTAPLVAA